MTRILMVRHGQSEWNAAGRWQGQADPPLTELGRRQAAAAATRIGAVDVVVSSDLERAVHTATIIGDALGVGPVVVDDHFRERSAGEWSGLTRDEIEAAWPGYLAERRRPPGFEPDESVLARLVEGLDLVAATYEGADVVLVAHGGLLYVLEHHHGLPFERLPNLGARWLLHDGRSVTLGERVALLDDEDLTTVPSQI